MVATAGRRVVARRVDTGPGSRGAVAPKGAEWRHAGTALVVALPIADGSYGAGRARLDRVRGAAQGGVRIGGKAVAAEQMTVYPAA